MITEEIERAIINVIEKRNELSKLDYNNPAYDELEDELHDLEDDLLEDHGQLLEEILMDVHDEYAPDIDVLSPLSYLAKAYKQTGENELGPQYGVNYTQGVFVEMDDYMGKPTKFVMVPNPLRIILNIDKNNSQVVWSKEASKV